MDGTTPQQSAHLDFIALGCNRTTQAAVWGRAGGGVAFAADRLVALYDPQDVTCHGVTAALRGHKDRVNCVAFIERGTENARQDVALISGSADNTAIVWKKRRDGEWVKSSVLVGHTAALNSVASLQSRVPTKLDEADLLATASADGTVRVWSRVEGIQDENDIVTCMQTISLGTWYAMALALTYLPGTRIPVLALGGTDSKVHLYLPRGDSGMFVATVVLQGHSNWIRGLAFAECAPRSGASPPRASAELRAGDLLLASASQDKYVRLWRFTLSPDNIRGSSKYIADVPAEGTIQDEDGEENEVVESKVDAVDLFATLTGDGFRLVGPGMQLSTKGHMFHVPNSDRLSDDTSTAGEMYTVMLHAVLFGHEDWVHSVKWQPPRIVDGEYHQPLRLISGSADKSMIIWAPDPESGIWVNVARMGEVGGATMLGFFGGEFSSDGKSVMAHGRTGTFHLWVNTGNEEEDQWQPRCAVSGHFASVRDVVWDLLGRYFISISGDRTARLFAPWIRRNADTGETVQSWHEIARPQVHGYDLHCVALAGVDRYVSAADEKVLRAFEAPETFAKSLKAISGSADVDMGSRDGQQKQKVLGASLPALGLSNKAVYGDSVLIARESDKNARPALFDDEKPIFAAVASALQTPPYEEQLQPSTLWPEVGKLYGHGYEVIAVAVSHNNEFVATSCKATASEHARVRLFSVRTWNEACTPLAQEAHSLTVTRLRFSPDDRRLLTAGRDRYWSMFVRKETEYRRYLEDLAAGTGSITSGLYDLETKCNAHARIVWDCAWSPDGEIFATGSRDRTVKIWNKPSGPMPLTESSSAFATLKFDESVTCVEFAPAVLSPARYFLAFGLDNGRIGVFVGSAGKTGGDEGWRLAIAFDPRVCHARTVHRLAFRPTPPSQAAQEQQGEKQITGTSHVELLSCGEDHSVRLFSMTLKL